jgi:hypothetical protein
MDRDSIFTKILAYVLLYSVYLVVAILIGALLLWVCVEVFEFGKWSWWNALVLGILIFVLKGLFQTKQRSD